jgi:hypothetical protein
LDPEAPDKSMVQYFRRMTVMKDPDQLEHGKEFFIELNPTHCDAQARFPPQRLSPTLIKTPDKPDPLNPRTKDCQWGALFDFTDVPNGRVEQISVLDQSAGINLGGLSGRSNISFQTFADRAELSMWILMPEDKTYDSWLITRRRTVEPEKHELVTPVEQFLSSDSSILGFELLGVKGGYTYDVNWSYK